MPDTTSPMVKTWIEWQQVPAKQKQNWIMPKKYKHYQHLLTEKFIFTGFFKNDSGHFQYKQIGFFSNLREQIAYSIHNAKFEGICV